MRASPLGSDLVAIGLNQESEQLGYYLALEAWMAPELTVLPGCCKWTNLFGHWIRLSSGIKLSIRVWALHFHLHWVPQPPVMAVGSVWRLLWLPLLTACKDFQCCNCWAKPKETRLELASEDGLQGLKLTGHCHACREHHVIATATFCCLVRGLSCHKTSGWTWWSWLVRSKSVYFMILWLKRGLCLETVLH